MTAQSRVLFVEVVLYALALWASVEMAKTPDQRRTTRLRNYRLTVEACWFLAAALGRLAMAAELAYYQEVNT